MPSTYRSNLLLSRFCSSLAKLQSAILFLNMDPVSPLSAAFLLDTLTCPPEMRKASFSLKLPTGAPCRPPLLGSPPPTTALRLFTLSRSFFTEAEMLLRARLRRKWCRTWTAAHSRRLSVTMPRATAAMSAGGASASGGLVVGFSTECSQRAPMKPCRHLHTGPE